MNRNHVCLVKQVCRSRMHTEGRGGGGGECISSEEAGTKAEVAPHVRGQHGEAWSRGPSSSRCAGRACTLREEGEGGGEFVSSEEAERATSRAVAAPPPAHACKSPGRCRISPGSSATRLCTAGLPCAARYSSRAQQPVRGTRTSATVPTRSGALAAPRSAAGAASVWQRPEP